jgi:peroxiredoxin Q/BCP
MGREYLGTARDTFIISPDGKIAKEYRGVNPSKHAAEIIADLKALQSK